MTDDQYRTYLEIEKRKVELLEGIIVRLDNIHHAMDVDTNNLQQVIQGLSSDIGRVNSSIIHLRR